MNTPHANNAARATERRIPQRAPRVLLAAAALLLPAAPALAQVATYDLIRDPKKFTLYTDPYNGNKIEMGGFSGLYPRGNGSFYVVTDRGPAPDYVDESTDPPTTRKTFAIPEFGPHLLTVRLAAGGKAVLVDSKPLRRPDGTVISGLPTTKPATDVPYDFNLNQLPYDEDSIDAEGISVDPWGNLWVCEEYKPSIAMVSPNGTVLRRIVPVGTKVGTEGVPTDELLPGVLAKRRNNRGFEGLAVSAEGILYTAVQRPLNNPNRTAADANGNARLVAVDLNVLLHGAAGPLVKQYLYQMPGGGAVNSSVTVSDVFSTGPTTMLIPERTTDKLFQVDVSGATDLTTLEDPVTFKLLADSTKTIEQLDAAGLALHGIVPVTKTVVLDSLTGIDPLLAKVEGVCVVDNKIVLTYDNDFNVGEVASTPDNPLPDGPFVQLELVGANYPKIFIVPMP
jgi:hypothetical protein